MRRSNFWLQTGHDRVLQICRSFRFFGQRSQRRSLLYRGTSVFGHPKRDSRKAQDKHTAPKCETCWNLLAQHSTFEGGTLWWRYRDGGEESVSDSHSHSDTYSTARNERGNDDEPPTCDISYVTRPDEIHIRIQIQLLFQIQIFRFRASAAQRLAMDGNEIMRLINLRFYKWQGSAFGAGASSGHMEWKTTLISLNSLTTNYGSFLNELEC